MNNVVNHHLKDDDELVVIYGHVIPPAEMEELREAAAILEAGHDRLDPVR